MFNNKKIYKKKKKIYIYIYADPFVLKVAYLLLFVLFEKT